MRSQCSIFRWANKMARFVALSALVVGLGLSLAGCGQATTAGGHVVGNGGDDVILLFRKGAEHARGVLSWLNRARLERIGGELDDDDEFILDDYNKSLIRGELAGAEIVPVDKFPDFCVADAARGVACTLPWTGAPIWVLRSRADRMSVTTAGEVMLHEVLHHFIGENESRVYRLGARVYRGFSESSTYVFAKGVRQGGPENMGGAPAVWDGEALLSWNPYRDASVARFVPGQGWRQTTLEPAPWWVSQRQRRDRPTPPATGEEVMLYSPQPGVVYGFFYRSGFDQLFGLALDFDLRVDTRTGRWEVLQDHRKAPRWGLVHQLNPAVHVRYAGSRERFVIASTFPNGTATVSSFDPKTETWTSFQADVGKHFLTQTAALVGNSIRLVGRFSGVPRTHTNVVRIDLKTHEVRAEGTFVDEERRVLPKIVAVNGGVVLFGGWRTWLGTRSDFRRDGAFLADDSTQWRVIKANRAVGPIEGNMLVMKEHDRIHFFGDQWHTWSVATGEWEAHPRDLGSFFAKVKLVLDAGNQIIFWNPLSRDGFAIDW